MWSSTWILIQCSSVISKKPRSFWTDTSKITFSVFVSLLLSTSISHNHITPPNYYIDWSTIGMSKPNHQDKSLLCHLIFYRSYPYHCAKISLSFLSHKVLKYQKLQIFSLSHHHTADFRETTNLQNSTSTIAIMIVLPKVRFCLKITVLERPIATVWSSIQFSVTHTGLT